jgi:hypothetical protein
VRNIFPVAGGSRQLFITAVLYYRPSDKKLARIRTTDRPDDEWGVIPDRGYALNLPPPELERLRGVLEEQAAIYPAGQAGAASLPVWVDRQKELALKYLRDKLNKP